MEAAFNEHIAAVPTKIGTLAVRQIGARISNYDHYWYCKFYIIYVFVNLPDVFWQLDTMKVFSFVLILMAWKRYVILGS